MKIVFHIDEMDKWNLLLTNAENLLKDPEINLQTTRVEVLANAQAVCGYTPQQDFSARMEHLAQAGIGFVACNNALQKHNLSAPDLLPFVTLVPTGIRELAERQAEGFAYIKP